MVQLRCGLLSTKTRQARWGWSKDDINCRGGCGKPESLRHLLQNCALTHDNRCRRHNDVCKLINKLLIRKHCSTLYEPRIPLQTSYCKPDLIVVKNGSALVLDVTVCDPELIASAWERKIGKYNTVEVNASIKEHLIRLGFAVQQIEHHPVVITYNGLLYGRSSKSLQRCGLTSRDISDVCVATMKGSLKCYDGYMRGTHTY